MKARNLVLASLFAARAATAPAVAGQSFLYTREIDVPAAGWVRVPLDPTALQHLAPGAADLHVIAPGGGEVPARIEPWIPRSERREVIVLEVERRADGWTLVLDTGTGPAPHERLLFDFARPTTAPAVRLEGSPDRKTWRTLATDDLFRVGEEPGLAQIALSYPATSDRYLRLGWPASAGYPRVSAVEVETAAGPAVALTTRDVDCDRGRPAVADCRLPLPAPDQILRRLTVELDGPGPAGYRLYGSQQARWYPLAQGVWQRTEEESRHLVVGPREPVPGNLLRLEIYGAGGDAPSLASYDVEFAAQTVLFSAEGPGLYTLAYGGVARGQRLSGGEAAGGLGASWLNAGPERPTREAEGPAPLPAFGPGARLPEVRFAASWDVVAAARPGDLVRLEVPAEVYGTARHDLGDLRLEVKGRQIPFFRWSPPEPALAAERRAVQPTPGRPRESQVGLSLPASGLPLTQLQLTVPARPLHRPVGVRYVERRPLRRRGRDGGEPAPVARETWECSPQPPLPCGAWLSLPGDPAPELLTVRFGDGDDPPLAGLDLALWRRRDVLVFAWPDEGPVRLLAGASGLAAPDYDLESIGDLLLAQPWQTAELDLEGRLAPQESAWWSRWIMPAALAVAGIFLLFLLRRILAEH